MWHKGFASSRIRVARKSKKSLSQTNRVNEVERGRVATLFLTYILLPLSLRDRFERKAQGKRKIKSAKNSISYGS